MVSELRGSKQNYERKNYISNIVNAITMYANYSVLMSVYVNDSPLFLRASIESIFSQTFPTDDLVLICDGVITQDLQAVIDNFLVRYPTVIHVFKLVENKGLGYALNYGLKHCKHELVARMDTDDICKEDRFEKQLNEFNRCSKLSLSGGIVEEFFNNPKVVKGTRVVPQKYDEIISFSRRRNPFNHPAVMFKKSVVRAVGGYDETYHLFEDYYLWVRILMAGYYVNNSNEVLLLMRTSPDLYIRRGGIIYAKDLLRFNNWMLKNHWIDIKDYIISTVPHAIICVLPNCLRKFIYQKIIRNRSTFSTTSRISSE